MKRFLALGHLFEAPGSGGGRLQHVHLKFRVLFASGSGMVQSSGLNTARIASAGLVRKWMSIDMICVDRLSYLSCIPSPLSTSPAARSMLPVMLVALTFANAWLGIS
eukprot:s1433_g12.t1